MRAPNALLLAFALCGCAGPSYYFQAASGHLELTRSRQDIDAYLATAPPGDDLAARLERAREILRFAAEELDLPTHDSFGSFAVTGREAVVWNVVATPEFSLKPKTWCFPVAGCVPYRGYFDPDRAHEAADRLRRKGLDVAISGATAYSSLGWFEDPLLDSMLFLPEPQLAGTLFHELAHQRLYVSGDSRFNESYATFVEREGVRTWLLAQGREEEALEWRARLHALDGFQALLENSRTQLLALYASGQPAERMRTQKRAIFADLRRRHDRLAVQDWAGRAWFTGWFEKQPNNADLALANTYQGGLCAFRQLLDEAGGDIRAFQRLAAGKAALARADRKAWLNQACS